jgi:hypothetical protein
MWSNGYYVGYAVEGVVTDASFGSSVGGVPIGTYDKSRDIGKPARHHYMHYDFEWAKAYAEGPLRGDVRYHLAPEYGVGPEPYRHDPSKIHHFLTMPESAHPLAVEHDRQATTYRGTRDGIDVYNVTFRGQKLPPSRWSAGVASTATRCKLRSTTRSPILRKDHPAPLSGLAHGAGVLGTDVESAVRLARSGLGTPSNTMPGAAATQPPDELKRPPGKQGLARGGAASEEGVQGR